MKEQTPLLSVRLDGNAVGPGKIPLAHLLRLGRSLRGVLRQTGHVLMGDDRSSRRGKPPKHIRESVDLDLVSLTHGSPSVVLGFEYKQPGAGNASTDFGLEVLEKAMCALNAIQEPGMPPSGYCDEGVMRAWVDMGKLFDRGVERIALTLNHREAPAGATFTMEGRAQIQKRINELAAEPLVDTLSIEGRLLMADFKENETRCRVHPSVGDPVSCRFAEEQKEKVFKNLLHFVRVVGKATRNPVSKKMTDVEIHDVHRLDGKEDDARQLSDSNDFWESPTLEELARRQGIKPMTDVRKLYGTWPGDPDDGFEEAINALRRFDRKEASGK